MSRQPLVEQPEPLEFRSDGRFGGTVVLDGYPDGPIGDAGLIDIACVSGLGPSASVAVPRSLAVSIAEALLTIARAA